MDSETTNSGIVPPEDIRGNANNAGANTGNMNMPETTIRAHKTAAAECLGLILRRSKASTQRNARFDAKHFSAECWRICGGRVF